MGKATDLAIGFGCGIEIDVGEGCSIGRAGLDAVVLEELVTNQVGDLALGGAHAQIHAGFTEPDRQQLSMTVGEMQERHIALGGVVIKTGGQVAGQNSLAIQHQTGCGSSSKDLQEFATGHGHSGVSLI